MFGRKEIVGPRATFLEKPVKLSAYADNVTQMFVIKNYVYFLLVLAPKLTGNLKWNSTGLNC